MKKLLLLLSLTAIIACESDDDSSSNGDGGTEDPGYYNIDLSDNFGQEISRDFFGQVIDNNQNGVEGAFIEIGGETATTDENGIFIIKNANVHEEFAYITATKTGYVEGSRALVPTDGTNEVKIMLLDKNVTATVASGSPETVSLSSGASVDLEGEYTDSEGNEYTGNVNVSMNFLDPEDENMIYQMPGMLYAANSQNEERFLQTFGMIAVELEGENGEYLNLTEGSTATIHVPLGTETLANAPSSIPLWHFDEDRGYWIEDGEATLQGNEYVGTVSHFSFWNCDIATESVNFCYTFLNANNEPISGTTVAITSNLYGTTYGVTNQLGMVCGMVPAGETFELNLSVDSFCESGDFYTTNIGPFNSDTSETLSISSLTNTGVVYETITGVFNDCNGIPVTNGYVALTSVNNEANIQYALVENGNFSLNLLRCENNSFDGDLFTLQGLNYENNQTTGKITYTFTSPLTDVGTLAACNTAEEYIQYSIDNGTEDFFAITNIDAQFEALNTDFNTPTIRITAQGDQTYAECFFLTVTLNPSPYIGAYSYAAWGDLQNQSSFNLECLSPDDTNNNIILNVNHIGAVGEYIDMNFSGDYQTQNGVSKTISGSIHVYRDQ